MPRQSNRGRGIVRTGDSKRGLGIGLEPAPVYHWGPRAMPAPPTVTPLPPTATAARPAAAGLLSSAQTLPGKRDEIPPRAVCQTVDDTGPAARQWPGTRAGDGRELRAAGAWPTGSELRTILAAARRSDSSGARCLRASLARCGLVLRPAGVGGSAGPAPSPLPKSPTDRTRAVLRFTRRHVGRPIGARRLCQAVRQLLRRQAQRELVTRAAGSASSPAARPGRSKR